MRRLLIILTGAAFLQAAAPLHPQEVDAVRIRAAVERALPPVQRGLVSFQKNWSPASGTKDWPAVWKRIGCFSCHHEGLGLTTLSFLGRRGFAVDQGLARQEADVLRRAYGELAPVYRRALTDEKSAKEADPFDDIAVQMGYMLGGLIDSGHEPDETTDASARILMKHQQDDGSWTYTLAREPMQSSDFATTAMAARVLKAYAPKDAGPRADEALARARAWLLENRPETTDDLTFRLMGLKWLGATPDDIRKAVEAVKAIQRDDGGWAQVRTSKSSDAYATGLALVALNQGGGVPVTDPAYRHGVAFLLETQRPDGTWFVKKWAHGYNTYFDAGFPYGKSQFISLAGTCYAMMALASAVEPWDAEKELTALAKESDAPFVKNDAAFFERVLADEWTIITPDGKALDKAQHLREMKDGTLKVESSETLEMKVRVYGDAAVITGRGRWKAKDKGEPIGGTVRWTDVYIKRGGKWQCVASQVTPIAAESGTKRR